MQAPLNATLTTTFDGRPLSIVDNLPGGFAELRPTELRALATTLARIADDCEANHKPGKRAMPVRKAYLVGAEKIKAA